MKPLRRPSACVLLFLASGLLGWLFPSSAGAQTIGGGTGATVGPVISIVYLTAGEDTVGVGNEGKGKIDSPAVQVKLSAASTDTVTVQFATADGTALAGQDYVGTSGTLVFAPGETSKTIPIDLINDSVGEDTEYGWIELSNPVNGTLSGTAYKGKFVIYDDDAPITVQFSTSSYTAGEKDGSISLEVKLSAATINTITVSWTSAGEGAHPASSPSDYSPGSGSVTFSPGDTTKTITLSIVDDAIPEFDEKAKFTLTSVSGGPVLGDKISTVLTILDDDMFSVTASAGKAAPNPTTLDSPIYSSLSATVVNPPPSGSGFTGPVWSWQVQKVEYSTDNSTWGDAPDGGWQVIDQADSSSADATLRAAFPVAGYWKVTVAATATYTDPDSVEWSATGTASTQATVIAVSFAPNPVGVLVNQASAVTAAVIPTAEAGQVSFSVQNEDGSDGSDKVTLSASGTNLTLTGVAEGSLYVVASVTATGTPCAWGVVNVSKPQTGLVSAKPRICAGGKNDALHQTAVTATFTDKDGAPQSGLTVTFSTSAGTLSSSSGVTNSNGTAATTLTSNSDATDDTASPPTKFQATVQADSSSGTVNTSVEFGAPSRKVICDPCALLPGGKGGVVLVLTWEGEPVVAHKTSWSISAIWDESGTLIYDGTGTLPSGYGTLTAGGSTNEEGEATASFAAGTNTGWIEFLAEDTDVAMVGGKKPEGKGKVEIAKLIVSDVGFDSSITLRRIVDALKDTPITGPEWQVSGPTNDPATFVRNTQFKVKVKLQGTPDTKLRLKAVKSTVTLVSGGASAFADVREPVDGMGNPTTVTLDGDGLASDIAMQTDKALDDQVDIMEVTWQWKFSTDDGKTWNNANKTGPHRLYLTNASPKPMSLKTSGNLLQLFEFGCTWAAGKKTDDPKTADPVLDAIWAKLKAPADGKTPPSPTGYQFWGEITVSNQILGGLESLNNPRALIAKKDGFCGSWAFFFQDLCAVQGIPMRTLRIRPPLGDHQLLVKNAKLGTKAKIRPAPDGDYCFPNLTIPGAGQDEGTDAKGVDWTSPGAPGQGIETPGISQKPNPDKLVNKWMGRQFDDHIINFRDLDAEGNSDGTLTKGERIYDPSYGLGPFTALADWEDAALVAFGRLDNLFGKAGGNLRIWFRPNGLGVEEVRAEVVANKK